MNNPGRSEILGEYAANPPNNSEGFGGTTIGTAWCPRCKRIRWKQNPDGGAVSYGLAGEPCEGCNNPLKAREWKVSALEDRITAQFEKEVRRKARSAYLEIEQSDPAEASAMRAQYMADFSAGAYNWDDDGANVINHVRLARGKTWGALYLVYLLLRRCDASVTEETARDAWIANSKDSLAAYLWALGIVGNSKAPAQQQPNEDGSAELEAEKARLVQEAKKAQKNGSGSEPGRTASEAQAASPQPMATFN